MGDIFILIAAAGRDEKYSITVTKKAKRYDVKVPAIIPAKGETIPIMPAAKPKAIAKGKKGKIIIFTKGATMVSLLK